MAELALTGPQRELLGVAVSCGGSATQDQMRGSRKKSAVTSAAFSTFLAYGLLAPRGAGYELTAAGFCAAVTGVYDSSWADSPPATGACLEVSALHLARALATGVAVLGVEFGKTLAALAGVAHREAVHPSGKCLGCGRYTSSSALAAGDWKCPECNQ